MLHLEDSYTVKFESKIKKILGNELYLEETFFYHKSGGQPGDQGVIQALDMEFNIIDTLKTDEGIAHIVDKEVIEITEGQSVNANINWDRRFRLMRMHTTMHLLCSIIPHGVTGGQIGEDKSRIDFDPGDLNLNLDNLNADINKLISEDHEVGYQWITTEELDQQPELVRTLSVKPPRTNGKIRLVKIGDIDLQPCGGTHVKKTSEIGEFNFLKFESKGKRNKRIQFTLL